MLCSDELSHIGTIFFSNRHQGRNFKRGLIILIRVIIEKKTVRIWKRYIPLLIDLLISNNFSSMTFFCATRILRVIGRQSIRQSTDFLLIFWHN